MSAPRRLGVVVHPVRDVGGPRRQLDRWAAGHGVELVAAGDDAPGLQGLSRGDAARCDALVAIGGDGTVLGAARLAAPHGLPVLGVACGSLGMLAGVHGEGTTDALDRFAAGDWLERPLTGLHVEDETGAAAVALNDVVVVRKGAGQVKAEVLVDGERYVRAAGDGIIVSTVLGSSAYGMAAGGPILHPGLSAAVVTPLAMHGGNAPSLVVPVEARLEVVVAKGFSDRRVEVDGQPSPLAGERLRFDVRPRHVVLVAFEGQESVLAGLRRRAIVLDSPRILAHDARVARGEPDPARGPQPPGPADG